MKVLITQSNYIPWKGYFDAIANADVFVVYDDMQYTKRDWRNRNLIKTPNGLKWMSIPVEVKGKFDQKINETKTLDNKWKDSHLAILKQNYSKAPYFKDHWSMIQGWYSNCESELLTEVNLHFIRLICEFLRIDTVIRNSTNFNIAEERTERLVSICRDVKADMYLTGPAAKAYMNQDLFKQSNIEIEYLDYSGYREYDQLEEPFEHGVTILDMIFNLGAETKEYLKFAK